MGPPYGSAVGRLGVGREVEDIRVSPRFKHDHIRGMTLYLTGYQVSRHNAACSSIDDHNLEQLPSDMHCHCACCRLLFQGLISPEQQLLSGLASRVKCSLDLHAAKRSSIEKSAIFPGKRHALGDALVDDIEADLGESIHVGLARAEVAAFDCVLKQAENAVAVVAIVLGGINPPLGCDRVGTRRGVMIGKPWYPEPWRAETGGRPRPPRRG